MRSRLKKPGLTELFHKRADRSRGAAAAGLHRDRLPPSIKCRTPTWETNTHSGGILDPSLKSMFRHSNQDREVGVSRMLNQLDQPLTLGFQFSEAIDHNKIGSFMDRGLNQLRNACRLSAVEPASGCT